MGGNSNAPHPQCTRSAKTLLWNNKLVKRGRNSGSRSCRHTKTLHGVHTACTAFHGMHFCRFVGMSGFVSPWFHAKKMPSTRAFPWGHTMHCAKSWLFSTTGSHGSQGPEFCTPQPLLPLLVHQSALIQQKIAFVEKNRFRPCGRSSIFCQKWQQCGHPDWFHRLNHVWCI